MSKPYVSIVLPAYNEEEAIAKVINDVQAAMSKAAYSYEILVVDDCSADRTAEIAQSKGVRVVRRTVQGGSGSSRRTGIIEAHGEIIVMLDADGSYESGDIPKLLSYFPQYDQVNGARTSEQGTLKLLRTPAKWIIRMLACYLTGTHIPDLNTGLKAFKKDIMRKYLWVLPDGFSCVTTMTLAFLANGYAVKYVPTLYHKRIGKSKFHPIKDTANYLNTVVRMVMYFKPLRVFGPAAIFLLGFAVIKSAISLSYTASLQESDIIIFMMAVMLGSLGLIADLIVSYHNRA
jgi:polyisoprenyl-phosphate glycosyltransferase